MTLEALAPDEVLALRFDEPAAAEDFARWCDGAVERLGTPDGVVTTLWVPTRKGPRPAVLGSWLVRHAEDDWEVMDAAAFEARHQSV